MALKFTRLVNPKDIPVYTAGDNINIDENNIISATYEVADTATLGLVKSSTTGTATDRDYAVEVNSNGTMKVNVPWTDTTYEIATSSVAGLVKSSKTGTATDRDYMVEVNSDGTMKVNVPWTNSDENDNDNQTVKTGSVTFGVNDVVEFVAGSNVSIEGDATNKTITISATGDEDTDTHYTNYLQITVDGAEAIKFTQDSDKSLNLKSGENISLSVANNEITINSTAESVAIKEVETLDDIPNDPTILHRYQTAEGSSNLVEVISTYHEAGASHEFRKTSTSNNSELNATSILTHLDSTISTFVNITGVSKVWSLYQAYNGEPVINGFRLGSGSAQGSLTFDLVNDGNILVTRYYSINGSTGAIASNSDNSQVIVDGTTYLLPNVGEIVTIPLTTGPHTITSGVDNNTRAIFLGFSFGGDAYYSYEKKHLARQEDLTALTATVEANKAEAKTTHTEIQKAVTKNAQDITALNNKLGDVQIFDVVKSLPKASMDHLSELYRKDGTLYQCVQAGDGVHKEFEFNLNGTSEIASTISDDNLKQVYTNIAKDFADYFTFEKASLVKVFRNNGSLKLGSSKSTGSFNMYINREDLSSLKVYLKAYNADKSAFKIRVTSDGLEAEGEVLIPDTESEVVYDLYNLYMDEAAANDLLNEDLLLPSYFSIATMDEYYEETEDGGTTTEVDPRGIITKIVADFGDVSYEWTLISGAGNSLVEVTYQELVDLRDNYKLVPGQHYRITDYETTVYSMNCPEARSAGHPFDIIVTADSLNTLNENARATKSRRDTPDQVNVLYKIHLSDENYSTPQSETDCVVVKLTITEDGTLAFYEQVAEDVGQYPADSGDLFLYEGIYEFGGKTYDLWWNANNDGYGRLTNRVVFGNWHFKDSKVESWEIKYCLDNDTTRFYWADNSKFIKLDNNGTYGRAPDCDENGYYAWAYWDGNKLDFEDCAYTDTLDPVLGSPLYEGTFDSCDTASDTIIQAGIRGKGVIYYMKDEYNNEAPYDFKNIQFWRSLDNEGNLDTEKGSNIFCYTFGGVIDRSIPQQKYGNKVFNNNIISSPQYTGCDGYVLPNNVFLSTYECISYGNTLGINCNNNTFGDAFCNNTLGNGCETNTFGNECRYNTFGSYCWGNTFGDECLYNNLGNSCNENNFFGCCNHNTIGDDCLQNTFGDSCSHNTLGSNCNKITLNNSSQGNTLEASCRDITIGKDCFDNNFGAGCFGITLGNESFANSFGPEFSNKTFEAETGSLAVWRGSIQAGGEIQAESFYATSDRRLKENIKEFVPQKSILDLPIVEFDFKESGKHQIGCIAQDLQEICPEVVETNTNGYLSINESKLVYLLIDEVKKLREEIENLKNK